MCVKCGGKCGEQRRGPRFNRPAPSAFPLEIVGTAGGVDHIPDGLIEVRGGMITYEDLFTGLTPEGQPAAHRIPGTFASHTTRARLERW